MPFPSAEPRSRHFSIGVPRPLSLFLGTVVVIAFVAGLQVAFLFWRHSRQETAIREIERVGGSVVRRPGGPDWMRRRVGDPTMKIFEQVDTVSFSYVEPTDAHLLLVGSMMGVRNIDARLDSVTDVGLSHLDGMTELASLKLSRALITDAGLAHIATMSRLRSLDVSRTRISDAGLVHLSRLTCLSDLDLGDTAVSDAAMPHILKLRGLRNLGLSRTGITDASLRELKGLTTLKHLVVQDLDQVLSDAAVAELKSTLPRLEVHW